MELIEGTGRADIVAPNVCNASKSSRPSTDFGRKGPRNASCGCPPWSRLALFSKKQGAGSGAGARDGPVLPCPRIRLREPALVSRFSLQNATQNATQKGQGAGPILANPLFYLVVRAVWCEPVSGAGAAISLLNREKTGNFCKNSLIGPQICR